MTVELTRILRIMVQYITVWMTMEQLMFLS